MFMNGIITPAAHKEAKSNRLFAKTVYKFRHLLIFVFLPTLIVAGYYYLVASDQYESTADFVVRRADSVAKGTGNIGALMGFSVGATPSSSEAAIVGDYLLSHDAVARLSKEDGLVSRFQRQHVDIFSALWGSGPTPESLLKYYRKHVKVEQNLESGISEMHVRAFTPQDARQIAEKLLRMGEQRVNEINARAMQGQLTAARQDLKAAEQDLIDVQSRITVFRRVNQDIDPAGTGKAQISLVSTLTANLVAAKARQDALKGFISASSPQYRAVEAQVTSLERQIAGQSAKLASGAQNIATGLGKYEDLVIRQEFAAKRYSAAAAVFEDARAQALKQQIYLVRVVDPNVPVKSLYPERGRIVLTVFCALLLAYGIGWLLIAGVKEHSL